MNRRSKQGVRRPASEIEAGWWIRDGRCVGQVTAAPLSVDEFTVAIVFVCARCARRHTIRCHWARRVQVEFKEDDAA